MLQTQQEMAEEFQKLEEDRLNGVFASEEEYKAARDALEAKYTEKFKAYSESYKVAIEADARAQNDTWTTEYTGMINKTGEWKTETTKAYSETEAAFGLYKKNVTETYDPLIREALGLEKTATDDEKTAMDLLGQATETTKEKSTREGAF